jgi:hypothetical protein
MAARGSEVRKRRAGRSKRQRGNQPTQHHAIQPMQSGRIGSAFNDIKQQVYGQIECNQHKAAAWKAQKQAECHGRTLAQREERGLWPQIKRSEYVSSAFL